MKEQAPITAEERAYNFYLLSGKKDVIQLMVEFSKAEVLEFAKWERINSNLYFTEEELVEIFLKRKK